MKLGGALQRRRKGRGASGTGRQKGARGARGVGGRFVPLVLGLALAGWAIGYVFATRVLFPAPPPPGDLIAVPDVRDADLATARSRIEAAGLELEGVDSVAHPTVTSAHVVGQAPLAGQLALAGTPVRLTVSTGPQTRSVPDVQGLVADQAVVFLEASGFVVQSDSVESEEPRGRVVAVRPAPGGIVTLPAEVSISVSTGPPTLWMPLLLGMEEEAARGVLESLGLEVEVEEVFRFGEDQGMVVEQDPAAEVEVEPGSLVRLSVGRRGG